MRKLFTEDQDNFWYHNDKLYSDDDLPAVERVNVDKEWLG